MEQVRWLLGVYADLTNYCRKIFPHESCMVVAQPIEGSALDRIRQRRAEKMAEASGGNN